MKRKAYVYMFAMILLILVSLSLTHTLSPKVMSAEMINVPDDYEKIQWAIGNASSGDTILVGAGTYYENVVVAKALTLKGVDSDITIIDGGGTGTGVKITADNVNVMGFTIRNAGNGIHLHESNGATVSGNTVTSNKYEGIYLQSSSGNTIYDNIITSNKMEGIYSETSTGNKISGNTITNNTFWGICLDSSSDNNTINGNTITSHTQWPGIYLDDSSNIIICNNTLLNNSDGILMVSSDDDAVSGNTISNNEVGIELYDSSSNTIHHNNFINNTNQIDTDESTNTWDDGAEGNYWSDYMGVDDGSDGRVAGDGVGDTELPHLDVDNYPLMNPHDKTNPIADAGPDQLALNGTMITFDGSGSTDNLDVVNYGIANYTWTFLDVTPQTLTGVKANYTFYNVGNFSVTLNVSDYSGNWDTDMMWVNVTETQIIRDVAITNITVSKTTVTTGEPLIVNVTVANEGDVSETFNVTVYYNSSVVGRKNVVSLASEKSEKLIFNWGTTGVPGGNYTIKAVADIVDGETNTENNERTGDKVTIKKLSSTISVSASPATITIGASTVINGSISPLRVEATVTIHSRLSGGKWSALKNVTTDADGRYLYNWTPTTTGNYEVKASWEGDLTHLPDESDVEVVTVKEAEETPTQEPSADIYLYAAAIAVIIIMSATIFYILSVRKPKRAQQPREEES